MIVKSSRVRLRNFAIAAVLAVGPILSACSSPTIEVVAKITSPAANSTVKVGEQLQIEGQVTGDGITQVDVVIDGNPYAQLTVQDKDKSVGVSNFPIAAGQVPWTPASPGPHALQLIVYKAPDNQLLKKSEPVLITAVPAGEQAQPTPDGGAGAPAAPPTPPPAQPTAAPSNNGGAQPPAAPATTAPGGNNASGAPSLTVINDFVNVRKGPGVGYDRLGQLDKGQSAPVKGKSADGEWLQISYPSAANGVGWVKVRDGSDTLVQPNAAANSVAVASAPPLPTSEPVSAAPAAPVAPAPSGGVTIVPLGPIATSPPAVLPTAIPQGNLVGAGGVIRVNVNPIGSGGTAYVSWNIASFRDGEFDRGDGQGFKGPIAGQMQVDVPGISSARTVTVRWRETNGTQKQDSITINVSGQAVAVATASADCNASNSQWQGGNSNYPFCVASGFYWEQGIKEVAYFTTGQDYTLTARWNIYGINGVRLIIEGNANQCGPAGSTRIDQASTGTGGNTININQLATGGYIAHLYVIRRDNVPVFYNEKFLCVGVGQSTSATSTPGPTATTTAPTPIPFTQPTSAAPTSVPPTVGAVEPTPVP